MKKIVKWLGFYVNSNVEVIGEPIPTHHGYMYKMQLQSKEYYAFHIKYLTKEFEKQPISLTTKDRI